MRVVFVVETDMPDDTTDLGEMAKHVMDTIEATSAVPTRAWATINEVADAVTAVAGLS